MCVYIYMCDYIYIYITKHSRSTAGRVRLITWQLLTLMDKRVLGHTAPPGHV